MLSVKTPDEALKIIEESFGGRLTSPELVSADLACGRVLAEDAAAREYVPDFDRSTVDGYAVRAADTFGCSESIPAILRVSCRIDMGRAASSPISAGECEYIPTGGALPPGADAAVMLEHTENYGPGEIGVLRPAAPGQNIILRGDDVFPGKTVLLAGRLLTPADVGALAAMGMTEIAVRKKPLTGIISTGDELVPPERSPGPGEVRDVNTSVLSAALASYGAEPKKYGIVRDDEAALSEIVAVAASECDMVLISGGSSVGVMDAACRVIESQGKLLLHGIAVKPGKPTILGSIGGKPVFGLPGHPAAAYFVSEVFVSAAAGELLGRKIRRAAVAARLTEAVSSNNGREQYVGAYLEYGAQGALARPVHGKSGLIAKLAGCDGYFKIPRDCEGFAAGTAVTVYLHSFY